MTNPIKILITEPEYFIKESVMEMKKVGRVVAKRMKEKELIKEVKDVDILVIRIETIINKKVIEAAKNLKAVVSATTGLNHIDVEALKERGIELFSLHGTHSVATAELALSLLFSVARNIPSSHNHILKGGWSRWKYIGTEINGKTLGIFGIGRVGTQVANRAMALGMKVIAYDPYVNKEDINKRGANKVEWEEFLKMSDFITLHAPLTKETNGVFAKKEISKMKSGVIIINSARGAIVDNAALIKALESGKVRGAGIDVYEEEPIPATSILRKFAKTHENLVLTPHLGASTRETVANASAFAADTIKTFLANK